MPADGAPRRRGPRRADAPGTGPAAVARTLVGVAGAAVLILAALAGTWTYSALRDKLPH